MESIIVDTSSILFGLSNKIDVFKKVEEQLNLKPVISKGVVKELEGISGSKKADNKYARVALSLIDRHGISIDESEIYVDRWILASAKEFGNVCTNDTKLRRELKSRDINTYTLSMDGTLR